MAKNVNENAKKAAKVAKAAKVININTKVEEKAAETTVDTVEAPAQETVVETTVVEQAQEAPAVEAPAVEAQEAPKAKGLTPLPKFANFEEACTYIKSLDNNELFKFARRIRVTWTGTNNEGINRMRCMMSIKDYYKRNLPAA